MFVRVQIKSAHEHRGILVPVSSVLRDDQNLPFVFVAAPGNGFARRRITLGSRVGDSYEIDVGAQWTATRSWLRARSSSSSRRASDASRPSFRGEHAHGRTAPRRAPRRRFNGSSKHRSHSRSLVGLITLAIIGVGIFSLQRLPVDAYPDLSPPSVEMTRAVARPRRRGSRAARSPCRSRRR